MTELQDLLREQHVILASLKATVGRMRRMVRGAPVVKQPAPGRVVLLRMAEALISAHRSAKVDGDGLTLDLIEDALRHVGERLVREFGLERNFSSETLGPL